MNNRFWRLVGDVLWLLAVGAIMACALGVFGCAADRMGRQPDAASGSILMESLPEHIVKAWGFDKE